MDEHRRARAIRQYNCGPETAHATRRPTAKACPADCALRFVAGRSGRYRGNCRVSPTQSMKPVLMLVAIFFAALVPTLRDLSRYHGDERYYTDAAITMIQSGDYLTPRYADGTERFKKPLLTY